VDAARTFSLFPQASKEMASTPSAVVLVATGFGGNYPLEGWDLQEKIKVRASLVEKLVFGKGNIAHSDTRSFAYLWSTNISMKRMTLLHRASFQLGPCIDLWAAQDPFHSPLASKVSLCCVRRIPVSFYVCGDQDMLRLLMSKCPSQ
jgi:hypothetical protein